YGVRCTGTQVSGLEFKPPASACGRRILSPKNRRLAYLSGKGFPSHKGHPELNPTLPAGRDAEVGTVHDQIVALVDPSAAGGGETEVILIGGQSHAIDEKHGITALNAPNRTKRHNEFSPNFADKGDIGTCAARIT